MWLVANLGILAIIFLNGFVYSRLRGTPVNPVTVINYFWFLAAGFPIALHLQGEVNPQTLIYILIFLLIFSFPFYFFCKKTQDTKFFLEEQMLNKVWGIILMFFFVSVASFTVHLYLNDINYLSYLANPFEITAQNVSAKYKGELTLSLYSQVATVLMFPTAFLSGFLYFFVKSSKRYLLVFFSFTVPVLFFIIFGDKGALFLVIFIFISGVFLRYKLRGERLIIRKKWLVNLLVAIVLLFILIAIAFVSRAGGLTGDELSDFLLFNVRSYALGHLHAFNDWFTYYLNDGALYDYAVSEKPFGFYTFKSLYDLLGVSVDTPMGIYDEYFNNGFLETNIYTVYRGLIYDFGILGSYIFALLLGALVFWSDLKLTQGRTSWASVTIWYAFFMFIYSSYIVSIFIWRTTLVSIFVVAIAFFAISRGQLVSSVASK